MIDSEYGEAIFLYGFFAIIGLILFYFSLIKLKNKKINFFLIVLIWCASSTVIFSYKTSFIFMFLLSNFYSNIKESDYYHFYQLKNKEIS